MPLVTTMEQMNVLALERWTESLSRNYSVNKNLLQRLRVLRIVLIF